MSRAQLLTPQQLNSRLQQENLILLDCRFALDDADYGQRNYQAGHIPGAQYADLERHLSAPVVKGVTGRHPLPAAGKLTLQLQTWGINQNSCVVLYDDGPGAFAARAWWLLNWLGKSDIFLLDGGLQAWKGAGLPLSQNTQSKPAGNFHSQVNSQLLIDASQLQQQLGKPELTLLDARALPRFRGEVEPLDPVAGHIPGAQCAVFTDNLNATGHWRSPAELRQRFDTLLNGRAPQQLVAYCGSGVTACHNLFALCLAGYPIAPLYAGSWSEWITDPARPIATGD